MVVWSVTENERKVTWWRWGRIRSTARRARLVVAALLAAKG
ncbi:MAG TPA: hypothetical protein VGT01_00575 [Candidatus Dormibacteraeota bacterium]|nr:hypothetical protein [Candidatus Dormibacteraeota bacterium]